MRIIFIGDSITESDQFELIYDKLLTQVSKNTNAKVVLMEPTIIEESLDSIGNEKLKAYVKIVNRLAEKYDAVIAPLHLGFLKYLEADNGCDLIIDGVHMNSVGNMSMTNFWLESTRGITFL